MKQTYAHVRREAIRQTIMITGNKAILGAVLATKRLRLGPTNSTSNMHNRKQKSRASTEGLKCTYCGNQKHTRENCFKLHGHPDWWNDLQAKKRRDTTNKEMGLSTAAVANTEPQLSFTPLITHSSSSLDPCNLSCVCFNSPCHAECSAWLLDSSTIDHMTFDARDFIQTSLPRHTNITNVNGVIPTVTGAGIVTLTPTLQLPNTLLVPSLSDKLLSVS
jgi:hypothetical protein